MPQPAPDSPSGHDGGCGLRVFTAADLDQLTARTGTRAAAEHPVGRVRPGFRVTSYVADELIDWPAGPDDPIYRLVFPAEDTLDMAAGIARAQQIFGGAYSGVSGLARTVRGPAMHDEHGIVCLDRTAEVGGQKLFVLRYLQARDPSLTGAPFFAAFSTHAAWLTDLEPVPGMRPPRRPPRRTRALADGIREFPTSHPFN